MSHVSPAAELAPQSILGGVRLERAIIGASAAGANWLAFGCGAVLVARRLAGGVTAAPGAVPLAALCLAGGLLVAVGDLAARRTGGHPALAARFGFLLAALATALPLPSGRGVATVMAVVCITGATALLVQPWVGARLPSLRPRPPAAAPRLHREPHETPPDGAAAADRPLPAWLASHGHLLQRQERFTRPDGTECVRGRLFLAVAAGVRTASGHVGFCPPFAVTPLVDVSTAYDAVEAVIAAADVLPWGVRIECRLDEPADEPFEIPIDVFASAPGPSVSSATDES